MAQCYILGERNVPCLHAQGVGCGNYLEDMLIFPEIYMFAPGNSVQRSNRLQLSRIKPNYEFKVISSKAFRNVQDLARGILQTLGAVLLRFFWPSVKYPCIRIAVSTFAYKEGQEPISAPDCRKGSMKTGPKENLFTLKNAP